MLSAQANIHPPPVGVDYRYASRYDLQSEKLTEPPLPTPPPPPPPPKLHSLESQGVYKTAGPIRSASGSCEERLVLGPKSLLREITKKAEHQRNRSLTARQLESRKGRENMLNRHDQEEKKNTFNPTAMRIILQLSVVNTYLLPLSYHSMRGNSYTQCRPDTLNKTKQNCPS